MNRSIFVLLTASLVLVSTARAQQPAPSLEMNGYKLSDFKGFDEKWKLVTTRYRTDTSELRFTYANPLAWKTLREGRTDYPDGAMFAKIGFATAADPLFQSSVVPTSSRRYQFMVRSKKKFAATDGWGYALFLGAGHRPPGDPQAHSMACAACHRLVQERGFVFSQPLDTKPQAVFAEQLSPPSPKPRHSGLEFETLSIESLPPSLREHLPPKFSSIRSLRGPMKRHLFQGTLDELRPALALEARSSKMPALLLSEDGAKFSAVFISPDSTRPCGKGMEAMTGVYTMIMNGNMVATTDFCN